MGDAASGTREGRKVIGRPVKPGQVLNPEGRNQYTYRKDFESAIEMMLKGKVTPRLAELIPPQVRALIEGREADLTTGQAIALVQIAKSLNGDEKAVSESLARIWPKVEKHELSGRDGGPVEVAGESPWDSLAGTVARLQARSPDVEADRGDEPPDAGETLQ